jgi:hypothetical protein
VDFDVIHVSTTAEQPAEFYTGEELSAKQRKHLWSVLYDEFPELLRPMDSPRASRHWDHPIGTFGEIKRDRLNRVSHEKRVELNRQLKDEVEASLIRPSHNEFGSPILLVRKAYGSLRLCIDYMDLRSLIHDDFPELLRPVDSPHVRRHWDHPIKTSCQLKHQLLNSVSPA